MLCRKSRSLRPRPRQNVISHANQSNSTPMKRKIAAEEHPLSASGKARSVIPNMCWYLAKALLPIGKKTRAIENVALARRVSARTPSTTEIPREDNGTRDGRMDSHGHPNGDPTPMRKGRSSGRPFFTLERSLHVKRTLFLDLVCV